MHSRIASVLLVVAVLFLAITGVGAYRLLEARITADVYRARLGELARDYGQLRDRYDDAVRRTAVTELEVRDGALSVSIRTAAGELRTIPTPYDPSGEIYLDYAVVDGRLWIRRVFDAATAPEDALLIDPALQWIDWESDRAVHGKAAYRSLAEGRWTVTVTGDGSLGLARSKAGRTPLASPPPIRRYQPIEREVADAMRSFEPGELIRALRSQSVPGR